MRKKYREEAADKIARELHQIVAVSTISMYQSVKKLVDPSISDEEKNAAGDIIDKMMITAESLFDDLTDTQKELYRDLATSLISMTQK